MWSILRRRSSRWPEQRILAVHTSPLIYLWTEPDVIFVTHLENFYTFSHLFAGYFSDASTVLSQSNNIYIRWAQILFELSSTVLRDWLQCVFRILSLGPNDRTNAYGRARSKHSEMFALFVSYANWKSVIEDTGLKVMNNRYATVDYSAILVALSVYHMLNENLSTDYYDGSYEGFGE